MATAPELPVGPVTVVVALAAGPENGATRFCGLSFLDRSLLALQYGGASAAIVVAGEAASFARGVVAERPRKLHCEVVARAPQVSGAVVLVAGDAVLNPGAVKAALAEAAAAGGTVRIGGAGGALAVLRGEAAAALAALPGGFEAALAAAGPVEERALPVLGVALRYGKVGRFAASRAMLDALRKGGDSWFDRYFTRNISLHVSKALASTWVTPNQLTFCALVCGLGCAGILLGATTHWHLVVAYAVGQLGNIMDATDGETARLTYKFSKYGTWFDTITDDVGSICIHFATGVACWRIYGNHVFAWVAWAGTICFAFYVVVLYYDLVVYVGSGDAHALKWWITPISSHEAGADLLSGRPTDWADFTRTISNREILLLIYLVTAATGVLPFGILVFGCVAGGLAFVAAGQVVVGYPGEPIRKRRA